jgi:2-amino-4-hydroxy-6-hydroxymethyldihydropteridine diphosphokinase
LSSTYYLIALGSNQRHPRLGSPREVVSAAMDFMNGTLGEVLARSKIIDSAPVGPSQRRYANAALVMESRLDPHEMLASLQALEAQLGRVRRGQRWRSRVIDLDIILWSGGIVHAADLAVPHPLARDREFVLGPAATIAPDWRDPVTGLSLSQLFARLTRPRPIPR